jgi:DNA-3-methyladenine glycosylase
VSGLAPLLAGDVVAAARGLLGARLQSLLGGEASEVILVEVEAYGGNDDPASHGHRGLTARNASMFAPAGTLYVYRSYGVHWCMNVVTGVEGRASAVLLRGGIPVAGEEIMRHRRGRSDHLTDGPGKLSQALGVTGDEDGIDLLGDGPVRLLEGEAPGGRVEATVRVGITRAPDRPWRFVLRGRFAGAEAGGDRRMRPRSTPG